MRSFEGKGVPVFPIEIEAFAATGGGEENRQLTKLTLWYTPAEVLKMATRDNAEPILKEAASEPEQEKEPESGKEKNSEKKSKEDEKKAAPRP